MKKITAIMLALPVMAGALACKKNEPPPPPPVTAPATTLPVPVSVSGISLGNAIGEDKRVTASLEAFAAKDTIYAVVETTGTGHAKLRALWSFVKGNKTAKVDERTLEFESAAPAVNEFHIAKPSGWPKGDYKVEIFLGDAAEPAAIKAFKVG